MAFNSSFFHGFICMFVGIILIGCVECSFKLPHTSLFVFGDSILDNGNNNYINTTTDYQSNWWPYGESFFKYPTGRPSDGRLISDFIAEYAKLPFIPSYFQIEREGFIHGVNFASSLSGCLAETNHGHIKPEGKIFSAKKIWPKWPKYNNKGHSLYKQVIDLFTQLKHFKKVVKLLKNKVGGKQSKKLIWNAVYMLSTGTVDYGEVFRRSPLHFPYPKQQFVEMVLSNFTSVLKEIYKKGGRKFAIFTLIPLGCFPGARAFTLQQNKSGDCMNELNELLKMHSLALPKWMNQLQEELTGFKYTSFDHYEVIDQRINNPSKFGFEVSTMACCGTGPFRGINSCGGKRQVKDYHLCKNPKDYVFFDSSHSSQSTYEQSAKLLWHGDPDVTAPYSLKSFFEVSG